jgi:hypothetical protein
VKPANLLVRKEETGWKVKLIDFGLAMPRKVVETTHKATTARQRETMIGSSIAGTLDYSAPEQMGRRKEPVGPYSDVYGWAKTCCYALFQTTQPLMKHWKSVPEPLAELLEKCLEEDPRQRPARFSEVLNSLGIRKGPDDAAVAARIVSEQTKRTKGIKSLLPWILGGVGLMATLLVATAVHVLRPVPQSVEVARTKDQPESLLGERITTGTPSQGLSDKPNAPPSSPNYVDEVGRRWMVFSDTAERVREHWKQGNKGSPFFFDSDKKTLEIKTSGALGSLEYQGRWKEFQFEIAATKDGGNPPNGEFDVKVNGINLPLRKTIAGSKGWVSVSVKYDASAGTVVAMVEKQSVARGTVLDSKNLLHWADTFSCSFGSWNGGWPAEYSLRNLRLLVE